MELKCFFVFVILYVQILAQNDFSKEKIEDNVEMLGSDDSVASPSRSGDQNVNPAKPEQPMPQPQPPPAPISPQEPSNSDEVVEINLTEEKPYVYTEKDKSGKLIVNYPTDYDPMTSRYAPWQEGQRGGSGAPYTIAETRLKEIRKLFMYPYFDLGGTADNEGDFQRAIQASTSQVHKNLNFQLPFFGFRFNYTRISLNGYLEFSDPPGTISDYPLVFPIKDWPKKNDPSFIGIFYSKCRIGSLRAEDIDKRRPGVYFRMERDLRNRVDRMGVEFRERLKWDIREGVIGAEAFDPKHALVVTWKNVSFAGGIANSLYVTNTFQMVLATDEVLSYVIFNYLDLQWTSHTEAGSDTLWGEGGIPAFVGFNAGNGTRSYEYTPYSQNSVIRDLSATGFANGFPGRHIFRVDENILPGTCNKDIDGANLKLVFAPESGNMLGGSIVNITGPCFELTDRITCKFDIAEEVNGVVIDKNRALCVQPRLYAEGYVGLEIAVGPGKYKWKGKYFVETPATAAQKIFFDDKSYMEPNPREFRITWVNTNLTTNENAPVRISLWGYRETTIRPEFVYITTLAENVQNNGEFVIVPSQYRNNEDGYNSYMKFGFIQINLTESVTVGTNNFKQPVTPLIWSPPIPLGWYFAPQWERQYGKRWPEYLCDEWLRNDRYLKNFAHELPQCPCTLEHALADRGRYMPDYDCDKDLNRRCYYHKEAIHCVRTGSPSMEGAEQQCCYDRLGNLMLSYDQQWGSSPRRSHNLGYVPWNEATKVPTLSQWYHDMVPKFVCCLWQKEQAVGCETLRFERRPSQDCVAYQAPGIAGVFGDPHIITFDDIQYTFNGKGEFVLLRSEKKPLNVQGRFEQMPMNAYGEVRATQLTSVVAKGNSSTIIEVRRRPKEARWRYRLDVLANGKRIYFDRPSLKFQHFPGVTVYTPTYVLNQSEVIMMFDTGAGVEVLDNEGYMSVRVYLPWGYINQTRGLLGNWSFDQTDDFTLPDGTKVASIAENANDFERIYRDFGVKWMLSDVDEPLIGSAMFHREFGKTATNYNNRSFIPVFETRPEELIPQNRSTFRDEAYRFCASSNNYQCLYDYSMTLDRDLAHYTSNYKASITTLKETNRKRVISCGVLETPRFGRKSNFFFTPGTKVMFECDENFVLVGDQRRECMPDGNWNVPEYGYTECLRQQEYSQRQAGIAAGIVLAIMIPIVLLFVYAGYKFFQKRQSEKEEDEAQHFAFEQQKKHAQAVAAKKLTAGEMYDDDDDQSSILTPPKETTVY